MSTFDLSMVSGKEPESNIRPVDNTEQKDADSLAAERYVPVPNIRELGAYDLKNPVDGADPVLAEHHERAEAAFKAGTLTAEDFEVIRKKTTAALEIDMALAGRIDGCLGYAKTLSEKYPTVANEPADYSVVSIVQNIVQMANTLMADAATADEKREARSAMSVALPTLCYRIALIEAGATRIKRRIRSGDFISAARFQEIINAVGLIDTGLVNRNPKGKAKGVYLEADGWNYNPIPEHIHNDVSLLYIEAVIDNELLYCVAGPDVSIELSARPDEKGGAVPFYNLSYNKYDWAIVDNGGRRISAEQITCWRYALVADIEHTQKYAQQEAYFNDLLGDFLSIYQESKARASGLILPK